MLRHSPDLAARLGDVPCRLVELELLRGASAISIRRQIAPHRIATRLSSPYRWLDILQ